MGLIRTVFLGTAELACRSLQGLAESPRFDVLGVVSQPDKAKGRQMRMVPTAVKQTASQLQIPVWQPPRLRKDGDLIARLASLNLDVIVVAAYGQLLPDSILQIPRHGCVNVHTSLLPKYRGAAPIHWAVLNGETTTGITIMKMDSGMDTGDIISQQSTRIGTDETSGQLHDRLAALGAGFLVETLPLYLGGEKKTYPQDPNKATHARKLTKEDAAVDWKRPAIELYNQIRGLNPWPGTSSTLVRNDSSTRIKFWSAALAASSTTARSGTVVSANPAGIEIACGKGTIMITSLQREGARRLEAGPFLSGFPVQPGDRFGDCNVRK